MDVMQELLNAAVVDYIDGIFTAMPCVVINVRDSLAGQMVDIQLTLNQKQQSGVISERPPILGVPVIFPASKVAAFTFPINKGDLGLAVFSMRNLDAWKNGTGLPSTPMNQAKFDKGDAVFIPGLQPPGIAINNPQRRLWSHSTSDAVLVNNIGQATEVEVRLKQDGGISINTKGKAEINCDVAEIVANTEMNVFTPMFNVQAENITWTGNVVHNGNYTATGTLSYNGVNFSTHVHGNSPGPSNP